MSETSVSNTLEVALSGAVLRLLQLFHDKYDREHSLTYTMEECLLYGIKAKSASKEYSVETQNRKKYDKELAADTSIIFHPDRMFALMKKYGIGHSNANLEKQVMEAAEKLQKEADAEELAKLEEATKPKAA